MTYKEEQAAIDAAAAKFPESFRMRAWGDRVFCINRPYSYVASKEQVILVVDTKTPEGWKNFSSGTPWEIEREVVR